MKNSSIQSWIDEVNSKLFTPISEKQVTFLESTANITLGGGARGGGKSWILTVDAMIRPRKTDSNGRTKVSVDYPQYTALLIRRSYADLIKNFKPFTDKLASEIGGKWVERRKCYEFPSG
ncbi:MAG: hypothetical protein U9N34_11160, partial [Candidatus Cloacimonadota bacterium]|nr:hypothetical protein [Candidatus Cloacimonadota bacterium]